MQFMWHFLDQCSEIGNNRKCSKDCDNRRPYYTHKNVVRDIKLSESNNYKNYLRLEWPSFGRIIKNVYLTFARRILQCGKRFQSE